MNRFVELLVVYPFLGRHPVFTQNPRILELVCGIAQLKTLPKHFYQEYDSKDSKLSNPLRPLTGDSPLLELLLYLPESKKLDKEYDRLVTWFSYVCLEHHSQHLSLETYRSYLLEGTPRRLNQEPVHRLGYLALLEMKQLVNKSKKNDLINLLKFTNVNGSEFFLKLACCYHSIRHDVLTDELILEYFSTMDEFHEMLGETRLRISESFGNFVCSAWKSADLVAPENSEEPRKGKRAEHVPPNGRTYSKYHGNGFSVTADLVGKCGRIQVTWGDVFKMKAQNDYYGASFVSPELGSRSKGGSLSEPDVPDVEPLATVFVSPQNNGTLWYQVQSLVHKDARENAFLPLQVARLSRTALRYVLDDISTVSTDRAVNLTKVAIALSLITGRPLNNTVSFLVAENGEVPTARCPLVVTKDYKILSQYAGQPGRLSGDQKITRGQQHFMLDTALHFDCPLPLFIQQLLAAIFNGGTGEADPSSILKAANKRIGSYPQHLEIRAKSLWVSFAQEVLEQTGGDLGMLKILSDGAIAIQANLIHYCFRARTLVENTWTSVVEALIGASLPPRGRRLNGQPLFGTYLGSSHAVNPFQVKQLITDLKAAIHQSYSDGDLNQCYSLLNFYNFLWISLVLAGRAVTKNALKCIIGHWAYMSDKAREQCGTDRIIRITPLLAAQMQGMVNIMTYMAGSNDFNRVSPDPYVEGMFPFRVIDDTGAWRQFSPLESFGFADHVDVATNLGRKLFEGLVGTEIDARFVYALTGHLALGRCPTSYISNLSFPCFADAAVTEQQRLEALFGLEVINPFEFSEKPIKVQKLWRNKPKEKKYQPPIGHQKHEDDLVNKIASLFKASKAETELDEKHVKSNIYTALNGFLEPDRGYSDEDYRRLFANVVKRVNKLTDLTVTLGVPRARFCKEWLCDFSAFYNASILVEDVIPAMEKEQEKFPAWPGRDASKTDLDIEFGRLLMFLMKDLALLSPSCLRGFLRSVTNQPIDQVDQLYFIAHSFQAARGHATGTRLTPIPEHMLLHWLSLPSCVIAYIRKEVRLGGNRWFYTAQRAVHSYLDVIATGNPNRPPVAEICSAFQQLFMLESAPALAACAVGELETHDAGVNFHRRAAGLGPVSSKPPSGTSIVTSMGGRFADTIDDIREQSAWLNKWIYSTQGGLTEQTNSLRPRRPVGEHQQLFKLFAIWCYSSRVKPSRRYNMAFWNDAVFVAGLVIEAWLEPDLDESKADYKKNKKGRLTLERLLGVGGLLDELIGEGRSRFALKLIAEFFTVSLSAKKFPLPKNVLETLKQYSDEKKRNNFFTPNELAEISSTLRSLGNGIPGLANKQTAWAFIEFLKVTGMRRNEAVNLRYKDYLGDVLRVREDEFHGIKTLNANRSLLVESLDDELLSMLDPEGAWDRQLIDLPNAGKFSGDALYDKLNKHIQAITGDDSLSLHSYRHTVASTGFLSLLSDSINVDALTEKMPWLGDSLWDKKILSKMSGHIAQSGSGLQALSLWLGHGHFSTTLQHYVHTAGIAIYGVLLNRKPINVERSFERRIGAHRSYQRWTQKWRAQKDGMSEKDYHEMIVGDLLKVVMKECSELEKGVPRIRDDKTPLISKALSNVSPELDEYLALENRLLDGGELHSGDLALVECLNRYAAMPTGRKGDKVSQRHPMRRKGDNYFPRPLITREQELAALHFYDWAKNINAKNGKLYKWFLSQIVGGFSKGHNKVRLNGECEKEQWLSLNISDDVLFTVLNRSKAVKGDPTDVLWGKITMSTDLNNTTFYHLIKGICWVALWEAAFSGVLPE